MESIALVGFRQVNEKKIAYCFPNHKGLKYQWQATITCESYLGYIFQTPLHVHIITQNQKYRSREIVSNQIHIARVG